MKHYIFSYGSLINGRSRELTGVASEAIVARVTGFKRSWIVFSEKYRITYLGVLRDPDAMCNGVLISVDESELAAFDEREGEYRRIEIDKQSVECQKIEGDCKIWIYEAVDIDLDGKYPIPLSYIDVVLHGCLELSEEFAEEFIQTTSHWGIGIVDDRENPIYQNYVHDETHLKKIDHLLQKIRNI